MKIFVSEYLCGGGWPGSTLPKSLAREGQSMLLALLTDLAADSAVEILTTWDHRIVLPRLPENVTVRIVRNMDEERAWAAELAAQSSATWIIAPEFDGILAARVRSAAASGCDMVNCLPAAIDSCADKLSLAKVLLDSRISTPRTMAIQRKVTVSSAGIEIEGMSLRWPVVVKPRDGAGSQMTYLVTGPTAGTSTSFGWEDVPASDSGTVWADKLIVQEYIPGRALSAAAIVRSTSDFDLLPVGEQRLSTDGRFLYEGGLVPATNVPFEAVGLMVRRAIELIPGLHGWVGFDFVLPAASPDDPVLIEINPRLTTSYLGYRALASTNLALRMLRATREDLTFCREPVRFRPDGTFDRLLSANS